MLYFIKLLVQWKKTWTHESKHCSISHTAG